LPWFWIRHNFLTEKTDLFLFKFISEAYWGVIFGIVFFSITIIVVSIFAEYGDYCIEKLFPKLGEMIIIAFPIALLAISIASFSIMAYHAKACFILVGNFLFAFACLGIGLTLIFILTNI